MREAHTLNTLRCVLDLKKIGLESLVLILPKNPLTVAHRYAFICLIIHYNVAHG